MRKRRLLMLLGALGITATSLGATVPAQAQDAPAEVSPDVEQFVVSELALDGSASLILRTKVAELDAMTGVDQETGIDLLPATAERTITSLDELEELRNTEGIDRIDPNYKLTISQDDEMAPASSVSNVNNGLSDMHSAGYDGTGYMAAIIDNGFDVAQLNGNVRQEVCISFEGYCGSSWISGGGPTSATGSGAATNYSSSYSGYYHGTAVACILACPAGYTQTGGAPDADLLLIRIFHPNGAGGLEAESLDLEAAMEWLADNADTYGDLRVINVSSGYGSNNTGHCTTGGAATMEAYVNYFLTYGSGVITTFSAGNNDTANSVAFPACTPNSLSVGEYWTDLGGGTDGSWGPHWLLDVAANTSANGISVRIPGGGTMLFNGTSAAAPLVSAAVISLHDAYSGFSTVGEVMSAIKTGGQLVRDLRFNTYVHGGSYSTRGLDAYQAFLRLLDMYSHVDSEYVPITPVRIVESWGGYGSNPIQSGTGAAVNITDLLGNPSQVGHYIAQVTLWGDGCLSVLGNYPTGGTNNGAAGTTSPGGTISTRQPLATNGSGSVTFQLYGTCTGSATLNYAVDIVGYFDDTADVNEMAPVRPINGATLASGNTGNYQVDNQLGIPSTAIGVYGMLTVTHSGSGFGYHDAGTSGLGGAALMVSHSSGMRNNLVYLPLYSNGTVDIKNVVSPGTATYYLDVFGYTTSSTTDLTIFDAYREHDSRSPSAPISNSGTRTEQVGGLGSMPSGASGMFLNMMLLENAGTPAYMQVNRAGALSNDQPVDVNAQMTNDYYVNTSVIDGQWSDNVSAKLHTASANGNAHWIIEPMAYAS